MKAFVAFSTDSPGTKRYFWYFHVGAAACRVSLGQGDELTNTQDDEAGKSPPLDDDKRIEWIRYLELVLFFVAVVALVKLAIHWAYLI